MFYDHPNYKSESSSQKSYGAKPYSRFKNHMVNSLDDAEEDENYFEISYYYFSINISGPLYEMQNIMYTSRWPKKSEKIPG